MGLGQPGPGFAYFLGAFGETDHIQTRGLVDLFWRSCWHDFVSTLYTISVQFPDNSKPMSRRLRSRCRYRSAKPMSRRMRRRCQNECLALCLSILWVGWGSVPRASKVASSWNGSPPNSKWKHAVRYVLSIFALITTSLPFISLAQYRVTN